MNSNSSGVAISVMLAVPNTPEAVEWYRTALGAKLLWSLGSVAGLEIEGAPFFLHEPVANKFHTPLQLGTRTARVEMFVDDPDERIARAIKAGATGGAIQDHEAPWGIHRQGEFIDPFGHQWHVGDKSPLQQRRF